jgi:hypothetical protein
MDSTAPKQDAAPGDFGTGPGDDEPLYAIVSASQLTGEQLETIVDVLVENSPRRVDWNSLVLGLVSAGTTAASVISKSQLTVWDGVALAVVGCSSAVLIFHSFRKTRCDAHPHYERALRHARAHAEAEKRRELRQWQR